MNYFFHPEALAEYSEAAYYYSEISSSLAERFIFHIENGIDKIISHPLAWQPIEEDIRRYLIKRFPFGIYYTIEDNDSIIIQAVMHLSREPDYWKSRIK